MENPGFFHGNLGNLGKIGKIAGIPRILNFSLIF
jgi:hypothetical protein